jgi:hypothetical protein
MRVAPFESAGGPFSFLGLEPFLVRHVPCIAAESVQLPMSAHVYRRNATDCFKLSALIRDQEARDRLKRMGIAWMDLADQAERNLRNDVVYEPRVLLQQQQPQKDKKE